MLWSVAAASAVTGLAFAAMKYLMDGDDPFSAYHHPLQPWSLAAHVLAGPMFVFVVGWVFGAHALRHVRKDGYRARRSGLGLLALVVPMVLAGYLMQTVTNAGARAVLAWVHAIAGLLFVAMLAGHAVGARRSAVHLERVRGPRTAA
jgi:hypothetical protein